MSVKELVKDTVGAPIWVKQIAESVLVIAASLSVIGINFAPYFDGMSEVAILEAKADLEHKYQSSYKSAESDSLVIKLESRVKELEQKSH